MTPVAAPPPPSTQRTTPRATLPHRARRFGAPRPVPLRVSPRVLVSSVLVHMLLVLAAVTWLRVGRPPAGPSAQPTDSGRESSLTYFDVAPLTQGEAVGAPRAAAPGSVDTAGASPAAPVPSNPGAPALRRPSPGRVPGVSPGAPGPAAGGVAAPSGSAVGRTGVVDGALRPGYRDPRLYTTPRDATPRPAPTEHERYMAGLEARIGTLNDSVAAEAERARRATDWTKTDKNGNRWGVSPGKIHLGKVTIPPGKAVIAVGSPFDSMPGPSVRKSDEQYQREEIQRQAGQVERDQIAKNRIRATRERKDAEREKRKQASP